VKRFLVLFHVMSVVSVTGFVDHNFVHNLRQAAEHQTSLFETKAPAGLWNIARFSHVGYISCSCK
jgi:hypothetical protein